MIRNTDQMETRGAEQLKLQFPWGTVALFAKEKDSTFSGEKHSTGKNKACLEIHVSVQKL